MVNLDSLKYGLPGNKQFMDRHNKLVDVVQILVNNLILAQDLEGAATLIALIESKLHNEDQAKV